VNYHQAEYPDRTKADLCFREVTDPAVHTRFKEVDFCEYHFVVQAFELSEEIVDKCECRLVLLQIKLPTIHVISPVITQWCIKGRTVQQDGFRDCV